MLFFFKKIKRSLPKKYKDEKLIQQLHTEHLKLLFMFKHIEENLTKVQKYEIKLNNYIKNIERLKKEIILHVTLEDHALYEHLKVKYKICDKDDMEKIFFFKDEIKEKLTLLELLTENIKNREYQKAKEILNQIKKYLLKRIDMENNLLYDIYTNTYKCSELKEKIQKEIINFNHQGE